MVFVHRDDFVNKFKIVSGMNLDKNHATAWHRQHSFTAER
jgi:hypothetical protein